MQKKNTFDGVKRAASHTLYMHTSPTQWANGLAIGNGQYGGLLFEPQDTVLEYAFTRLDLWKRHLVGPKRLPLSKFKQLMKKSTDALLEEINKEFHDTERPGFKPGGRLRINLEAWGLSHAVTLFDKRMEMDIAKGEVRGSYELASKASKWTALTSPDDDITAIHVEDTYLHYLCRFPYRQRVELYRLEDPEARILENGVTEDGIAYIIFDFNEELKAIAAFTVDGRPFKVAKNCEPGHAAVDVSLNYEYSALDMLQSSMEAGKDAYNNTPPPKLKYDVFHTLIVDVEGTKGDLLHLAREKLLAAKKEGFSSIQKRNQNWWRAFWKKSGIALENPALEGLWYSNLYQMACTSRGDVAPGLFGLWNAEAAAPWSGDYHGNINFAMYAWPLFAINHPELHQCVFKTLESWFPNMRKETKEAFGVDELRFPQATGPEGREMSRGHYRTMRCSTGFYADHFIKWHQYDPDPERLRNEILPILESAARYYFLYCDVGENGRLWIGPSWAPEQGVFPAWNTGNDLALFKELFQAVVDFNKELGQMSPTAKKAQKMLDLFPDYPAKDGEFIASASEKGRTLLCHPSYLANVMPAEDIDADSPIANVALKTMREHLDHTFRKSFQGKVGVACDLTGGWLFDIAVKMRDAEYAETMLHTVLIRDFIKSNGMFSAGPGGVFKSIAEKRRKYNVPQAQPHALLGQMNTVQGRAEAMSMIQNAGALLFGVMEAMLQSHGRQLKLFPVPLPSLGGKCSFHNLAAVGGLEVSAAKDKKGIRWFKIKCGKYAWNGTVRFFDQSTAKAFGKTLPKIGENTYSLSLKPGEVFQWRRPGATPDEAAVPVHAKGVRSYGKDCPITYGEKKAYYES
ncbi:MAG: hypothetical protein J5746_07720 [Victivallales bacterium]|nr:hypothetical protein [Victivallales bacterium]